MDTARPALRPPPQFAPPAPGGAGAPRPAPPETFRVGLLLPLSGGNAALGEAMLDAAQLALFQQGDPRVEFLPRDTRGTPQGAANAAREALSLGARAIAGPLTLGETSVVAQSARGAGVPLLAFTSDEAQAVPGGVWVLGITPTQAVRRVVSAAAQTGARQFALVAPEDAFGQRLAFALRQAAQELGAPPPRVAFFPPRGDAAAAAAAAEALSANPQALIVGAGGLTARQIAELAANSPARPRLLGTHIWFGDAEVAGTPALAGAWFPGPDPGARGRFEADFARAFVERPPRLAGVAYDAAALAARAARTGAPPVGEAFMGADGPIRMDASGRLLRGLAIYEVRPGGEPVPVQPAPEPGAAGS